MALNSCTKTKGLLRQFEINMKTKAVIVNKTGTPDVLDIQEIEVRTRCNHEPSHLQPLELVQLN